MVDRYWTVHLAAPYNGLYVPYFIKIFRNDVYAINCKTIDEILHKKLFHGHGEWREVINEHNIMLLMPGQQLLSCAIIHGMGYPEVYNFPKVQSISYALPVGFVTYHFKVTPT